MDTIINVLMYAGVIIAVIFIGGIYAAKIQQNKRDK